MRRTIVLGVIVLSGVVTAAMLSAQQAPRRRDRAVKPVRTAAVDAVPGSRRSRRSKRSKTTST